MSTHVSMLIPDVWASQAALISRYTAEKTNPELTLDSGVSNPQSLNAMRVRKDLRTRTPFGPADILCRSLAGLTGKWPRRPVGTSLRGGDGRSRILWMAVLHLYII